MAVNYYIGIDLGTSGLKGILVAEDGAIVRQASASYGVSYPRQGWTEQNPSDWIVALDDVMERLLCDDAQSDTNDITNNESGTLNNAKCVKSISFGG